MYYDKTGDCHLKQLKRTIVGLNIHMHFSHLTMCMFRVRGGMVHSSTVEYASFDTSHVQCFAKYDNSEWCLQV